VTYIHWVTSPLTFHDTIS